MNDQSVIPAKAINSEEQSDAIVVSFGSEWHQHLKANSFSVVIRKRVPKSATFKWLYFHINSPVSAICARAPIVKIFNSTLKETLALAKKINLTSDEITSYFGNDSAIGCYALGDFVFSPKPVTTESLAARLAYYPPQSFFIISSKAKDIIDEMAGFKVAKSTKTRTRPTQ